MIELNSLCFYFTIILLAKVISNPEHIIRSFEVIHALSLFETITTRYNKHVAALFTVISFLFLSTNHSLITWFFSIMF